MFLVIITFLKFQGLKKVNLALYEQDSHQTPVTSKNFQRIDFL